MEAAKTLLKAAHLDSGFTAGQSQASSVMVLPPDDLLAEECETLCGLLHVGSAPIRPQVCDNAAPLQASAGTT